VRCSVTSTTWNTCAYYTGCPGSYKGEHRRSNTRNIRSEVLRVVACQTNVVKGPTGPETKNGCAGVGQQQIIRPVQIRVITL
jgi:hypothetical protein